MILNQLLVNNKDPAEESDDNKIIIKEKIFSESLQSNSILQTDTVEAIHQEINRKNQQFGLLRVGGGFMFEGIIHLDTRESHYRVTTEVLGDIGPVYSVNICTITHSSPSLKSQVGIGSLVETNSEEPSLSDGDKEDDFLMDGPIDYSSFGKEARSNQTVRSESNQDVSFNEENHLPSEFAEHSEESQDNGPIDYSSKSIKSEEVQSSLEVDKLISESSFISSDVLAEANDKISGHIFSKNTICNTIKKAFNLSRAGTSGYGISKKKGGDILNVFLCPYCIYCCIKRGELKKHYRAVHLDGKPYGCPYCPYRSTHKSTLRAHVMSKHTGERPYECPHSDCDYKASQKGLVDKHIMTKHTGEKPFKCPHCEFSSSHSSTVKTHVMFKHTGEKPFFCPQCSYRAVQRGHVDRHIRAVHTGEKPYQCPHCEYRACRNANIKKHVMSVHKREKPHACPYCSFKSSHKGNLNSHIISKHTEVKPYVCPHCEYKSSCRTGLNRHLIKHTAKKKDKLKCHYCTYSSDRKDHLRTHVTYVHFKRDRNAQNKDYLNFKECFKEENIDIEPHQITPEISIKALLDTLSTHTKFSMPSTSNPD